MLVSTVFLNIRNAPGKKFDCKFFCQTDTYLANLDLILNKILKPCSSFLFK